MELHPSQWQFFEELESKTYALKDVDKKAQSTNYLRWVFFQGKVIMYEKLAIVIQYMKWYNTRSCG